MRFLPFKRQQNRSTTTSDSSISPIVSVRAEEAGARRLRGPSKGERREQVRQERRLAALNYWLAKEQEEANPNGARSDFSPEESESDPRLRHLHLRSDPQLNEEFSEEDDSSSPGSRWSHIPPSVPAQRHQISSAPNHPLLADCLSSTAVLPFFQEMLLLGETEER